jgi:glycosyltransferase involved in cell wall biosynthesis
MTRSFESPARIVGRNPYLVLTKQYPAYHDLYRYGFLHSRVRAYAQHGLAVDVFRLTAAAGPRYREFENIDVASGDTQFLYETLQIGRYRHVLVHLLDEKMWGVLQGRLDDIRITVWVHGAEIQTWQRRAFEFDRLESHVIERRKRLGERRLRLWRSILRDVHPNLGFVFVSNWLLREAQQDIGIAFPSDSVSVIPNFVDESVFRFQEKAAEDRKCILSIRPFSSRKYANDLTVAAILKLANKPCFKEMRFTLVGDGELFEETVAPLQHLANVVIERRFLTQQVIARYHALHGIFLVPTRMDAQGVSRDEAMASGLVPVTNNVAAIPEFVDDTCGMVVAPDDPAALAEAIQYLYAQPDVFLKLSRAAAERVKRQSGFDQTIKREMQIILDAGSSPRQKLSSPHTA